MKKYYLATMICGAIFGFMGCSSTPISFETLAPIAFVSVAGNVNVPYELDQVRDDEYGTEEGLLSNSINRFFGKNNPEILTAQDRVDYATEQFARALKEIADAEVVDKEKVVNSSVYVNFGEGLMGYTDVMIRGTDYKSIDFIGSKNARLLMKETGANSLMFATFTFKKQVVKGSKLDGTIGALAKMNVSVYDSNGKNILDEDFEAKSTKTIEISKLDYDKDELVEMFPELIDVLINQFIMKYM